jgi:hypothetical protein
LLFERIKSIRTATYRVFGIGPDGKMLGNTFKGGISKPIGPLGWVPRMWTKIRTSLNTRMTSIQQGIFRMAGLGVDGKPLGNTFKGGPHGGSQSVAPNWQTKVKGGFRSGLNRIHRIVAPFFKLSAAIVKFLASAAGISLTTGLKTVGATFGKLIGRILWPVTLIFGIFEAFKAGKKESMKEDSNWFDIIGETLGGFWGYIIGGLADVVKNVVVWLIQKAFGLKTDEDGVIIGDGLGVKILNIIKEFSFMDLIRKIIAMPWHLISNIFEFVKGMFTSADYRAGVWDWITSLPSRIANWAKGLMPDWLRKVFGIEMSEDGTDTLVTSMNKGNMRAALEGFYKASDEGGINPITKEKWNANGVKAARSAFIAEFLEDFMSDDAAQGRIAAGGSYESEIIRAKAKRQLGWGAKSFMQNQNFTIMNYQTGVDENYLYDAVGKSFTLQTDAG